MNLRENQNQERFVRTDRLATPLQPVGRVPSPWLAYYPVFQDALQHGATTFQTLPQQAKFAVPSWPVAGSAEQIIASGILDDVRGSFIELSTQCVVEVAETFLSARAGNSKLGTARNAITLGDLSIQIPSANYPQFARPPCVLRPGVGIFLNGWMRFFGYWTRGDRTIPLLAID
jgi:hypothetical protein